MWEVDSGRRVCTYQGRSRSAFLSGDGRLALSTAKFGAIELWKTRTGRGINTFELGNAARLSLNFDGSLLVSARSLNEDFHLWKTKTGKCLKTFPGHKQGTASVSLSHDGKLALSAGFRDKTVKLWEINTGRCLHTFEDADGTASLSGDGSLAVSSSYETSAELWDANEVRRQHSFQQQSSDRVTCVSLSQDGRLALTGSKDHSVELWEIQTARRLTTFDRRVNEVSNVCLSDDGRVALAHAHRVVSVWETESGRCLHEFEASGSTSLSGDGRLVLSGGKLWEAESGCCLHEIAGGGRICALTSDGRLAFTSTSDRVMVWETDSGQVVRTIQTLGNHPGSMSVSSDGRLALTGHHDGTVKLWHTESGRCLFSLERAPHGNHVDVSVTLGGNDRLALVDRAGVVKVWTTTSPSHSSPLVLSKFESPHEILEIQRRYRDALQSARQYLRQDAVVEAAGQIELARQQPGYERSREAVFLLREVCSHMARKKLKATWPIQTGLTSMSDNGCVASYVDMRKGTELWDTATGNCLHTFERSTDAVSLSGDGRIAALKYYSRVELLEATSGRFLKPIGHERVSSVYLNGDGRVAVTLSDWHKNAKLWETDSGRCIDQLEGDYVEAAMNEDGSLLLLATRQDIKTYHPYDRRWGATFEKHTDNAFVHDACLSSNGQLALTANVDNTARLWETATGRCLVTFEGHTQWVTSVSLSEDGRLALTASADKTTKLWETESGHCLHTFQAPVPSSARLSGDACLAIAGGKLWFLDWEFGQNPPAPAEDPEPVESVPTSWWKRWLGLDKQS